MIIRKIARRADWAVLIDAPVDVLSNTVDRFTGKVQTVNFELGNSGRVYTMTREDFEVLAKAFNT